MAVHRLSTRELLAASLEDLIKKSTLDAIKIEDIAHNCELTRQTFYNNFIDKYDLVTWIFCNDLISIFDRFDFGPDTFRETVIAYFELIKKKKAFYKQAFNRMDQNSVWEYAIPFLEDAYGRIFEEQYEKNHVSAEYEFALRFFIQGSIVSITGWIMNEFELPTEEFADLIISCMPPIVRTVLIQ